ncbi:putative iron-regulated membrane protein [Methylovorus glucosotrophus]|uniref:PepSY-associated TM helix domain-containing protein n=1 Tax=Methylovorus glucosotrophus TaxID=266009 RepID=UPI0013318F16|nr:PepSY domain-containing protein [Methylovorus glucosotrophus]KAF0844608.1 putative iron-regulated membrane protein [Methylovorus glucosotrophus]
MNIRLWYLTHKWTSLLCTIFLLMLCLTGLPLIFHEEIEHFSGVVEAPLMAADTPDASLDAIVTAAKQARPNDVIQFMFWDAEEHPHITQVSMSERMDTPPDEFKTVLLDSRTANILDVPPPDKGFMYIMLKLHTDMFAGLPGTLFLGLMGLLFVAAVVSGIVLYQPFMRKLDFGTVRKEKSQRLKWLDVHNLIGIVTIVWVLVVGITGSINTLSQIIIAIWQQDQMAEMLQPYKNLPPPTSTGSLEKAMQTARQAVPDMHPSFVAFPGSMFSSPHHYTVFMKGNTPLTSRLLKPALIDTTTSELTDTRDMPWYVKTLLLSQPLHFGDYGGLPLKMLWTLFDMFAIVVLGSGLYLWWGRRKRTDKRISELEQLHLDFAVDLKEPK